MELKHYNEIRAILFRASRPDLVSELIGMQKHNELSETMKLTQCGCDVCEEGARKLLDKVNEVCNRYPVKQVKRCPNGNPSYHIWRWSK